MTQTADDLAFVAATGAQIDRVVVRGHELAGAADKPPSLAELKAIPALLSTASIVLLSRPLTRAQIAGIVPYTPVTLIDALTDNNVAEGIIEERDGAVQLTDLGRTCAQDMVALQESAVTDAWVSAGDRFDTLERAFARVVEYGRSIGPLRSPSNFELFAAVCDRPTPVGRILRTMTAVRYWRADAHLVAVAHADLRPFEAHALNRLWDADRGVDRVGQGFPEPGRKGVASLEERGLAAEGAITDAGRALREQIERDTDRRTSPIYDVLDVTARAELLRALRALPA